jgi:hypothetical protein
VGGSRHDSGRGASGCPQKSWRWCGQAESALAKPFPGRNQARRGFNPRPEAVAAVASVAVVAAASAVTGRWVRRWPCGVGNFLTAPGARGRGLCRAIVAILAHHCSTKVSSRSRSARPKTIRLRVGPTKGLAFASIAGCSLTCLELVELHVESRSMQGRGPIIMSHYAGAICLQLTSG